MKIQVAKEKEFFLLTVDVKNNEKYF